MLKFETKNCQNTCYQTNKEGNMLENLLFNESFKKGFTLAEGATHVDVYANNRENLLILAEGATHVAMSDNSRKFGFTLAEVLITLAVIGVVAAITLPNVIANINARSYAERQVNIAQKVTQAMEQMRAHGLLNQNYNTTDDFVDELQKFLKIAKRCDSNNVVDCWPSQTIIDGQGKTVNVSEKAKTGKGLNLDTETNNVGLILADGASIILNYNNKAKTYDIGDEVKSESVTINIGNGKVKEYGGYRTTSTDSVAFVMDVNGSRGPNSETLEDGKPKDIRSFNGAIFAPTCQSVGGTVVTGRDNNKVCYLGTNYSPVNCTSAQRNSDDFKNFCGENPSPSSDYADDYWAGAQKACLDIGLKLASREQIDTMRTTHLGIGGIFNGNYWSSSNSWGSFGTTCQIQFYGCANGGVATFKNNKAKVICTK